MSQGPPSQRDRRSLKELAKFAASTPSLPSVSDGPKSVPPKSVPPPPSSRSAPQDSGIVDLKAAVQADPEAEQRAKTTPLASEPLFADESAGHEAQPADRRADSVKPPKGSVPPAPSARPAAKPGSAAAQLETKRGSSTGVVIGVGVLAAAAAGVFFFMHASKPAEKPVSSAPTAAAAPRVPAPTTANAAKAAPAEEKAAGEPAPAAEPEADEQPEQSEHVAGGGRRSRGGGHKIYSKARPASGPELPGGLGGGGSAVSPLTAMMAKETKVPDAPPGALGAALKQATTGGPEVGSQAVSNSSTPQFAPGSVPEKPPQGAVTSALGSALPNARNCLGSDDPISHANITFASSGNVSRVVVTGGAAGKTAEDCIRTALMKATVPPFAQSSYSANVTIRPNN